MDIEKAKKLKRGQTVQCPADGRRRGFTGVVTHVAITGSPSHNHAGEAYIWVEVQGPWNKSVWPSNRLS